MTAIRAKMLKLRILYYAVIAFVPISSWVAEQIVGQYNLQANTGRSLALWHSLLPAIAILGIVEGFWFRQRLIPEAERALTRNGSDPKALKQWEAGHIVGFAMAASVAGWGLVLRLIVRGRFWESLMYYVVSLLFLMLWTPRMPSQVASA